MKTPNTFASQNKRLLNLIIDYFFSYLFAVLFWIVCELVIGRQKTVPLFHTFFTPILLLIQFLYYLLFESILKKTPAKFITQTQVLMKDGSKANFVHILGRSLCRFIPFDAFSFLGSTHSGWHDSITKTIVINEK